MNPILSFFIESSESDEEYIENDDAFDNVMPLDYQNFNVSAPVQLKKANHYVELLQIGKEISKFGSTNDKTFQIIKDELMRIKNKYLQSDHNGEVVEVVGRKRGRPKAKKFSKNSTIRT